MKIEVDIIKTPKVQEIIEPENILKKSFSQAVAQKPIATQLFEKSTFWDINLQDLDTELHKTFIICRIVEHGLWNDYLTIRKIYSLNEIKQALTSGPKLTGKAKALADIICKNA